MNPTIAASPDVLVVGAGPVGLALASELSRHGVRCRIVDMNAAPSIWSKAAVVHTRTLEAFEAMGVAAEAVRLGRKVHGMNLFEGNRRIGHVGIDGIDSPYGFILGLSQRETELLLERHLAAQGVQVERRVELVSFEQTEGGVTAKLAHFEDAADDDAQDPGAAGTIYTPGAERPSRAQRGGREEVLSVPWLVGCDGSHSLVRKTLELPFEGSTYEESVLQADVRVTWPYSFSMPDDEGAFFLSPGGPIGVIPLLAEGRYRLVVLLEPGETYEPTLETFQALLDARGPKGAVVSDPAWMVGFRFHQRMVSAYREGRVFLAGDAAHIHSPAGGQGMNMGILDAVNLAWKLALVVRGKARRTLLDSYDAERRPIAAATLRGTDALTRAATRGVSLRSPLTQELRNQLIGLATRFPLLQERAAEMIGGLTVDYRASPIVAESRAPLWTLPTASLSRGESPGVLDWISFDRAPPPGGRVGDVDLAVPYGNRTRLFELLRGTKHTLLLFDGGEPTPEGYANLMRIAGDVLRDHRDAIQVYVVIPYGEVPEALNFSGPIVLDEDGSLHRYFGARSECLYLVRPDGYVAFRSQPADGERLAQYLDLIFTSPAGA